MDLRKPKLDNQAKRLTRIALCRVDQNILIDWDSEGGGVFLDSRWSWNEHFFWSSEKADLYLVLSPDLKNDTII